MGDAAVPVEIVHGDLLDQDVDAIVNAWNRNVIPWWLLVPQGVSRSIKRAAGHAPFRELARAGVIPLGGAVRTGAGRLPHRAIIHVAGINLAWRATDVSVARSVHSALAVAGDAGISSVAFPLIGAGTGGKRRDRVERIMREAIDAAPFPGRVVIVHHAPDADA